MKHNTRIFSCLAWALCVCVVGLSGCDHESHLEVLPELLQESQGALSASNLMELTDLTFDEHTQYGVALVDFWRPGCPPCEMMNPILNRLAKKYASQAQFYKVNILDSPRLDLKYKVDAVPYIVILHNGKMVREFFGLTEEVELQTALEVALAEFNVQTDAYMQKEILVPNASGQLELKRGTLVDTEQIQKNEEQRLREEEQKREDQKQQILSEQQQ